jgi:hypothetical protein
MYLKTNIYDYLPIRCELRLETKDTTHGRHHEAVKIANKPIDKRYKKRVDERGSIQLPHHQPKTLVLLRLPIVK